jgi:GTP cyclohydrolase I
MIGQDPTRKGLLETPLRVIRAFQEMTQGYDVDLCYLMKVFEVDERCSEMVVVKNIEFTSLCEHHLLPFMGTVSVGYIPQGGKVLGLSKIPRIVDAISQQLQLQEQMTFQIAETLMGVGELHPVGVGVITKATHGCMSCRGVKKKEAETVTSVLLGCFKDAAVRNEFIQLTSL